MTRTAQLRSWHTVQLLALCVSVFAALAHPAWAADFVLQRYEAVPDAVDNQWISIADGKAVQVDPYYGNYTSTHSWTSPPDVIPEDGFSVTLSVEASIKTGGGITAGTGMGGGFNFDTTEAVAWAVVPNGRPGSNSGSKTVRVTPPLYLSDGQEVELRIGGSWGKGVTYRYRAVPSGTVVIGGKDDGNDHGRDDKERLAASLDCPPSIVISALPTTTCTITITNFRRNTADPVEVIFPQMADGWGNHPNGIQVINAAGEEDAYNWDKPHLWPFSVFACPAQDTTGANCFDFVTAPGQVAVPILVRQAGSPDVSLTLMMAAIARGERVIDGLGLPAGAMRFGNREVAGTFLNIENGVIASSSISADWLSAIWDIYLVEGTDFVRLCNRWKPEQCLNTETQVVQSSPIRPEWWSAMWIIEPAEGTYFRIRNRWLEGQYLHMQSGALQLGAIDPTWDSAMWWSLR